MHKILWVDSNNSQKLSINYVPIPGKYSHVEGINGDGAEVESHQAVYTWRGVWDGGYIKDGKAVLCGVFCKMV